MIQIRNVPDAIHQKVKMRALLEGKSLSDYLLDELTSSTNRPTVKELQERLTRRAPIEPKHSPAEILRKERDRT